MKSLIEALWMCSPLVISGVLHMIVVKVDFLSFLKIPIHKKAFGVNKTWRGIVFMPLATAVALVLLKNGFGVDFFHKSEPLLLGGALGLAYVLFELPNSFIKRRLGVPSGKVPNENRFWFVLIDHVDSLVGCVFVYIWLLPPLSFLTYVLLVFLGPSIHITVNLLLYFLGVRKEVL